MAIDSEKHTVLIFAPYFPPRLRVGAIRPYRFSKYLSQLGWKVSVISIGGISNALSELQKKDLANVEIYELDPPFDSTTKKSKKGGKKGAQRKNKKLSKWIDKQFPIDTWLPFFWLKKRKLKKLVKEINPNIIWSTSDPWSGGLIAGKLAHYFNIPWIADFRDPWTLCSTRFPEKGSMAQYYAKRTENWIVEHADWMTFTAKATESKYINKYEDLKNKTSTIYNSFDYSSDKQKVLEPSYPRGFKNMFNIFFMGSFRELSTAQLIIEILKELKDINPPVYESVFVHSYGNLIEKDFQLATNYGVAEKFITRDKVPFSKVPEEINKADLLLLSTHPDRDDIVPAKLFDYLKADKPILSVIPNYEVRDILEDTNKGQHFGVNETKAAAEYIISLYSNEKFEQNCDNSYLKYSSESTAKELSELLKKVIKNG